MFESQTLCVVVPAFNTGGHIAEVLRTVPDFVDHVIVVDDGSTDGTGRIARAVADRRVEVLPHRVNRGVGAAIASGYQRAFERGADLVAVMAGDGQMDPRDLGRLAEPVARGRADYAKGNRLDHPACMRDMPFTRWLGNVALSAMTRLATGLRHVSDSQCGYTVISRRVLASLDMARLWSRYGYPNHLLGALAFAGFRVADVVVRPVYAGERSGVRLRDALITVPRILALLAWARLRARRALDAPATGRLPLDLARDAR